MSVALLERYLPPGTLPFLRKWFADYSVHIKITKGRASKLGDYRKLPDGSHVITVNSTLPPQLFFFVLTHELAHLVSFENFGRRTAPHGREWKATFRQMLLESITVYEDDLRPIIIRFAKSPKANFMASPELVRYFNFRNDDGSGADEIFVENLPSDSSFLYKNDVYLLQGRRKINYICKNIKTGKVYLFKPLALVKLIKE